MPIHSSVETNAAFRSIGDVTFKLTAVMGLTRRRVRCVHAPVESSGTIKEKPERRGEGGGGGGGRG